MTRLLTVTIITSLPNKSAVHIQFKHFSTLRSTVNTVFQGNSEVS